MTRRIRPKRAEDGFTLIELLVVIIILGILAAAVVFAISGVNDRGQTAASGMDAKSIRTAEEAFCARHGQYGTSRQLAGIDPGPDATSGQFLTEEPTVNQVALVGGGTCGASPTASGYTIYCDVNKPGCGTAGAVPDGGPTGSWTPVSNMNVGGIAHSGSEGRSGVLLPDGRVFQLGTSFLNSRPPVAEIFDPSADPPRGKWTLTTGPGANVLGFGGFATLLAGSPAQCGAKCGQVLVQFKKGSSTSPMVWKLYNPVTDSWSPAGTSPPHFNRNLNPTVTLIPPQGALCGSRCGKVLVTGGSDNTLAGIPDAADTPRTADIYDPATDTWSSTASFSPPPLTSSSISRQAHVAAALTDGRVLVVGNSSNTTNALTAQLYDPTNGTWSTTASVAAPLYKHGNGQGFGTTLSNNTVMMVGGRGGSVTGGEIYDPLANAWTPAGNCLNCSELPVLLGRPYVTRILSPLPASLAALIGDGLSKSYNPLTNAWDGVPGDPASHLLTGVTVLRDGRVLVAGGFLPVANTDSKAASIYTPPVYKGS